MWWEFAVFMEGCDVGISCTQRGVFLWGLPVEIQCMLDVFGAMQIDCSWYKCIERGLESLVEHV